MKTASNKSTLFSLPDGEHTITALRGVAAFDALQSEWSKLYARTEDATAFNAYSWLKSWLLTLGEAHTPTLLLVLEGTHLRAAWPLCEVHSIGSCGLWPMGYHTADNSSPLVDPSSSLLKKSLIRGLLELRKHYAFIWLPLLSEAFFAHMTPLPKPHNVRKDAVHKWVDMGPNGFDSFFESCFGKKAKSTLRYTARKLEAIGEVHHKHFERMDDVIAFLPRLKWVERNSWKHAQGVGLLSLPDSRSFYEKVIPELAKAGSLRIDALYAGEEVIAYQLGFLRAQNYQLHNIAYNKAYSDFSPGTHLLIDSMRALYASGIRIFDFLQGSQDYKNRFAPSSEALVECSLYAPSLSGYVHASFVSLSRFIKHKNRQKENARNSLD